MRRPVLAPSSSRHAILALSFMASTAAFAACSDDDGDTPGGSGGTPNSGGAATTGGASSTGGKSSGGTAGAGGGPSSGGATGTGGAQADGGVPVDLTIDDGPLRGTIKSGINSFLGIPFAATTGGANRWKAPRPPEKWTEPRDASEYGPICPQNAAGSTSYDPTSSEDCLNINVWSPDLTPDAPLPVLFWIYGGAFVFGSGGGAYEGIDLAKDRNVVVVTFNYRLSALGFLVHPALEAADTESAHGAYGIQDQQAALKWVKANIAKFGGDPGKVTIFGESAGARSACFHLLSEGSAGLFSSAIVESGFCTVPGDPITVARARGERFATAKGCTDAANAASCLRALPPEQFVGGPASPQPGGIFFQNDADVFFFQAIVDGKVLKDQPAKLLSEGKVAKVPVLHGATTAEGALFSAGIFQDKPVTSEAELTTALTRRFRDKTPDIVAKYPIANFATPQAALDEITGDSFFVCSARRMARNLTAAGVKNYLYSFDGRLESPELFPTLKDKAFHSADIPFVFGNDYVLGSVTPEYQPLRDAMQVYWTNFARGLDPNGSGATAWPEYTAAGDEHLVLAKEIRAGTALKKELCDFWDATPIPFP